MFMLKMTCEPLFDSTSRLYVHPYFAVSKTSMLALMRSGGFSQDGLRSFDPTHAGQTFADHQGTRLSSGVAGAL